uniref:Protein CIP2A n=1 Tax=Globodera rostochiensis TaxID=31243 RepID=A0A914GXF9_GLORO
MTSPFGASLELSIKSALPFLSSSTHGDGTEPVGAPDPILTKLIHESASLASTARLEPCSSSLAELLHRCALLLCSPTTRPLLRSKILLLLSNFFLYNVSVRKSAANSEQICLAVFHCLRAAFDDHLGPQNVIDVLRIIQMLTYERVNFGDWIFELLPFLTREILNAVPSELLPYCMCILCNLVSQSKPFTNRFKQMDSFKCFCSRILQLLSHNSKAVVISALVLVGYLDEKTRDTVYSSQNISQTFLCIFNILSSAAPDVLMTTHIAVDLLRRLVINQPKSPNDIPMLNATARDLTSYEFFEKSIQKAAGLLNLLDPRSEESRKIVQLFLAFCQLDELRGPTSVAIVAVEPNELKLNTPAHALVNMARLDFEEAIFPEVPLTALQLLAFVVKESVEAGKGIRRIFSSFDPLCALIKQVTRTVKVEPNSPLAPFHAKLIAEGLRLAESLANDEDFRPVLLDIVHAQLCADIFGEQLGSNPIVHHWLLVDLLAPSFQMYNYEVPSLNSSSSSSKGPSLPLWSINAIAIPIQLMRLLASLKDHSKPHKELYWRSLKDHRLLPFMAYAIARGTSALVYDAFVLFTHCAQVHDFPLKRLSILTAKCAALKNASRGGASADGQQASRHFGLSGKGPIDRKNVSFSSSFEQQQQLPLFAEYTNGGFPSKGGRAEVSEMVKLVETLQYELQAKEKKERELEKKLSEHSPAGGGGGTTGGINGTGTGGAVPSADQNNNLRRFVNELERRVVEADAEIAALSSEKGELLRRVERLQKALDTERAQHASALGGAERDRQMLVEENERERALHAVMRDKFDEMRRKFDTAAKTVFDKQSELDKAVEADKELNKRFHEQENELATRRMELEGATKMLSALNGQVADREMRLNKSESELRKFREHNNKLSLLSQQMAQLLGEFEAAK